MEELMSRSTTTSLLLGRPLGTRSTVDLTETLNGKLRSKNRPLNRMDRDRFLSELEHYRDEDDLDYNGDMHLITIAPTGSGKGCSVIIPNLLRYDGPVVVTDPKGENYAVTARARRALGQQVYVLEPFGASASDALNPFDMFSLPKSERETDAQMFADLLALDTIGDGFDQFWHNSAFGLLSGVIAFVASLDDDELAAKLDKMEQGGGKSTFAHLTKNSHGSRCTFTNLITTLHNDDVVYNLAVVLDTLKELIPPMAYREIATFLGKADKERSGVLSTANSYLKAFNSGKVLSALDSSSFQLNDIVLGKPISLYIIIPPDKLKSHKALLRLWTGMILKAITSRTVIPEKRTLLILDECAQLGTFPFLESAITLCRGYGLQTWTFWQDLAQLTELYKIGWSTIINNCGILQFFGANNYLVAKQLAALVGLEHNEVRHLNRWEQILLIDGDLYQCCKFDYREDREFYGLYDQNPFYANY